MTDSDPVADTLARNAEQRHAFITEWAEYVRTQPDADWGQQVNRLVNAQLASARHFEGERPDLESIDSDLLDG